MEDLIRVEKQGLYCPQGEFYIDPWRPVEKAVITHAHGDHARSGSRIYYSAEKSKGLLQTRLGEGLPLQTLKWGEKIRMKDTWVSLHPAGHILGSAQVRIEYKDQVWVASGDYKRSYDPTCDSFEVVPCDCFISEATFALPIYHWQTGEVTAKKIFEWWQSDLERPSMLFCYSLGKAQRVLAELKQFTDKKVYLHGATESITKIYRETGIEMVDSGPITDAPEKYSFKGDLILAPPSAHRSPWMKRFKDPQTAFASGWMQVRGARRRKGYEKGFVLSDHADWNELNQTIQETGAKTVFLTHGRTDVLQRFLTEQGKNVRLFETEFDSQEESIA